MAEILRSLLFIVAGLYIVLRGAKQIKKRQATLDPMEKVTLFILQSVGKTEGAVNREREFLKKKNPIKSGWSSLIFGGIVILMGILGLIAGIYFEMIIP